jgi:hypothetical protein
MVLFERLNQDILLSQLAGDKFVHLDLRLMYFKVVMHEIFDFSQ